MPDSTAASPGAAPDLRDPMLRIAREDERGNLAGYYHRRIPGGEPVAWSALSPDGTIAEWGWLIPGTAEPVVDDDGNRVTFGFGQGPGGQAGSPQPPARRRWPVIAAVGGALAVVAAFALIGAASDVADVPAAEEPPVSELVTGGTFDFAGLEGRDSVVFLYAPWCPYCAASMPTLAETSQQYSDEVDFVTVGGQAGLDDVEEYIGEHGITDLTNVFDGDGAVTAHFGQRGVPVWIFTNDDGARWTLVGLQPDGEVADNIERLIANSPTT